jgi:hypothetical protein
VEFKQGVFHKTDEKAQRGLEEQPEGRREKRRIRKKDFEFF